MTTTTVIYEIVILIVLILFGVWGAHRGFVRTLCSLIALLVALVGALLLTNLLSPTVAGWLTPVFEPSITSTVENALPEEIAQASLNTSQLQEYLQQSDLPLGLNSILADLAGEIPDIGTQDIVAGFSSALAGVVAQVVASAGLFLIFFIVILLLWRLISKGLNLVTKLPVLNFLNKLAGFIFGVVRGGVFAFAVLWVLRTLGVLTQETIDDGILLRLFDSFMS
ncbi:MAG: CvpA family protein [Oscillospiraceae bacterium]|nr:CvpA family protein [Oscillospiraceae bacterium]